MQSKKGTDMSYTIEYLEKDGIILITNIGEFTYKDFMKQAMAAKGISQIHNCKKYLADCTSMIMQTSTMEIYNTSSYYNEIKASRQSKIALLVQPGADTEKVLKFYETVCINFGLQAKMFSDKESAMQWLQD